MKHVKGYDLYIGSAAERTAAFPTVPRDSTKFYEEDTEKLFIVIREAWVEITGTEVTLNATLDANLLGITGQELTLDNQSANLFFAGPVSGGAAAPSFRAIDLDDLPFTGDHIVEDAVTAAVTDVVRLVHNSTGTPAVGFGTGMEIEAETDTTPDTTIGRWYWNWSVVTHASRRSGYTMLGITAGSEVELVRIETPQTAGVAGNTRGRGSVDLQGRRTANTQVASGIYSTIGGGARNTASLFGAVVSGGYRNTASNSYATVSGGGLNQSTSVGSTVGGGGNNEAINEYATVAGGVSNIASGQHASIGGGAVNTAFGEKSVIGGGNGNNVTSKYGMILGGFGAEARLYGQNAQASGTWNLGGDAQTSVLVASAQTTSATPTELFLDATLATERIDIAADTTYMFNIMVAARRTDANNESAGYGIRGVIDNNAGTTALVGAVDNYYSNEDSAWDVTVDADDTNDSLRITVTGENSKTVLWVARIELVEVNG